MKSEATISAIIHEVNTAHGIDCNAQARYHIAKQCRIARTEFERKWNELGVWLIDNTDASVPDIQTVRAMLNRGESVRGYKTEER
jgi:hypothetical protein